MRLLSIAAAAAALAVLAVAAPALSRPQWHPHAVDFELRAPVTVAGSAKAASGAAVSAPLRAPKRFDVVGLHWRGAAHPGVALRTRSDGGSWSRWTDASAEASDAPDPASAELRRRAGGYSEPVWAGRADWVQYRLTRRVPGLRLHFVNSTGTATAGDRLQTAIRTAAGDAAATVATALGVGAARAQADPGMPHIVRRSAWGGDDCKPRAVPAYGHVKAVLVHHTVTANGYGPEDGPAMVLGICRFHRDSNGWNDVGYNFLVDKYGTLYEGRAGGVEDPVVGAQAQGYNAQTSGVSVLGTYSSTKATQATLDALAALIRWKLPAHGQPTSGTTTVTSTGGPLNRYPAGRVLTINRTSGHRDGDSTECPGNALYRQLADLRALVGDVQPTRARTDVDATVTPTTARYPGRVDVTGHVFTNGGARPPAGTVVEVQAFRSAAWRPIGQALTTPDGAFDARVAASSSGALRASVPGGPAMLHNASRPLGVRVQAALTVDQPPVSSAHVGDTPVVGGRIRPSKRRVYLVVDRLVRGSFRHAATIAVDASSGRFLKGYRLRRSGRHRLYVVFRGDAAHARAVSPYFFVSSSPAGS